MKFDPIYIQYNIFIYNRCEILKNKCILIFVSVILNIYMCYTGRFKEEGRERSEETQV